ncbi:MAG: electron transport complex subunit RsxC [Atopobiaceae bacterium]|nr:electron transport complex subunit RsxC [Atopobiaceae bacterium]MDO4404392.1 electron transport complex subunit RsxC [Atopobiaceae bacterium]
MGRSLGSVFKRAHAVELRGIHIPHNKATAEQPTTQMPLPSKIVLPMRQHVGAPCVPQVKRRQQVEVGQLVGHSDAHMSADIFSPVSGIVREIRQIHYSDGRSDEAVVIEPDGEQLVHQSVAPPQVSDFAGLIEALSHSGIVGLGGGGFPAHVKMDTDLSGIDTWLVNGAECEPYLSTDYREMMEHPDTILEGIKTCLDLSGIKRSLICIEDNKPRAIELLRTMSADDPRIDVFELPARYPQGASRVILRNVMGLSVPRGGHLTDVGALLYNVTTMSEIGRYLRTGMPLIKRRLTVMGDAIARPQNLEVYIGTPISEILEYCGCAPGPRKVIIGGPMMGTTQVELDVPIVRQNCGLLAFGVNGPVVPPVSACIKCSRCIDNCPIRLSPIDIHKAYTARDVKALDRLMADLCVECGTCSYVCPSKQPLVQSTHLARALLRSEQRKAKGRR